MFEEWNGTAAAVPTEQCIHELFEEQVERTPEAMAVMYADEQLSLRGTERAGEPTGALPARAMGVGPEVLVGSAWSARWRWWSALLGILKAGGAYVPLDPAYPQERLAFMLEDAEATVLSHSRVTDRHLVHDEQTDRRQSKWHLQ